MPAGRPRVTMLLAGREIAVRRSALRPAEVAAVVGESERDIIDRLRCGDLVGILGSPQWLVRSESAAALVEDKVAAQLLGPEALDRLARLIEKPPRRRGSFATPR